ncbi:MAG: hypothetical protein C4516_09025 [Oxalobacter sp.]|nr:MAG: hypothetical protein C4516_09025 [Oxalobacter sp.]
MQMRIRKNTVSLIRTVYDPSIKRGRSVLLGTVPLNATTVPDELYAKLTNEEQAYLDGWLRANQKHLFREASQRFAKEMPEMLEKVASWYRVQRKTPELAALANSSREAWTEVLAAMVDAGVGRTRNRSPKKKPA